MRVVDGTRLGVLLAYVTRGRDGRREGQARAAGEVRAGAERRPVRSSGRE